MLEKLVEDPHRLDEKFSCWLNGFCTEQHILYIVQITSTINNKD